MIGIPKVSVMMAAYNVEKYIDEAVGSVLAQTYQQWELVVVDDGSTDGTGIRLEEVARKDSRIRVFHNEVNLGLGATRRIALELAQGSYAAVLDADDVALPEWLSSRVQTFDQHPEVVLVSGSRILIGADGARMGVTHEGASSELLQWRLLFGNPVNQPSCMFRLENARNVGGYMPYPYLEDWDLFVRLCSVGRLVQLDEALMMYRIHAANTTWSAGADRERLEPVATQIMRRALEDAVGLEVPEYLTWYLFRGRYLFCGDDKVSRQALDFLCTVLRQFLSHNAVGSQGCLIGAAALEDAANILRCGGWSPVTAVKGIAAVTCIAGIRVLSSRHGLFGALKILLLPAASGIGRVRSRRNRR